MGKSKNQGTLIWEYINLYWVFPRTRISEPKMCKILNCETSNQDSTVCAQQDEYMWEFCSAPFTEWFSVSLDIIKFTALPDSSYEVIVVNLFPRCRSNAILISIKYRHWLWGTCSIGEAHRFWIPHLWPYLVILWLNWVELQLTVMGINVLPGDLCREVEALE